MVTKQWSQSTYTRGESAEDVYWVDATDEEQATRASGVPAQNTSHLLDARLLAQAPTVRPLMPGTLYEVRIRFTRLRGDGEPDEENPLDAPPLVHWQIGSTNEPVDADVDGNPLVNSVGDLFEGLTEEFPTLFLTYTRNESTYDVQKALAYGNKTNSDTFTINGPNGAMTVNIGQALCRSITTDAYRLFAANGEPPVVPVEYNFEFREDGFKRVLMDQGFNGRCEVAGTKKLMRLVDDELNYPSHPVRLKNGIPVKQNDIEWKVGLNKLTAVAGKRPDGAEVEGDQNCDFLSFKRKKSIAFAGLNL